MTRQSVKHFILFFLIACISYHIAAEEIIDNELGYSMDFPEGFTVSSYTEDGMSYLFEHSDAPVTVALRIYEKRLFNSSEESLASSLKKLSATFDTDSILWSNKNCAIASFKMTLDKKYSGWSVCAPVGNDEYYLVCICYCPEAQSSIYNQFIVSTLNSLCIDKNFYNTPGIIVSYAFPKQGQKKMSSKINGRNIEYYIDTIDEEAAQFTVELEYAVLVLYAGHSKMNEAWQRYYKMIYRDNAGRIAGFCESVKKNIYSGFPADQAQLNTAAALLKMTQNFEYKRGKRSDSDFTNLVSVLAGQGNDCDSRSLLICSVMNYLGCDSILLFSGEYKHALAGVAIDAPGQKYTVKYAEGITVDYLMGETTAKVTFGTIAQEHADRSKWNFVAFN